MRNNANRGFAPLELVLVLLALAAVLYVYVRWSSASRVTAAPEVKKAIVEQGIDPTQPLALPAAVKEKVEQYNAEAQAELERRAARGE